MSPRKERLDKRLAQEGFGTRSEIRKAVGAGKVSVNGHIEKDPGRKISPEDEIFFEGEKVGQETFVYYMLNKPAGVITATEDETQRTVLDLLRSPSDPSGKTMEAPVLRRGLFPVGRLDRDTEGLLLITDDGQLAHCLLAPGRHVDKVYYAIVTGEVTGDEIRKFAEGLQVGKEGSPEAFTALPAKLETLREDPERTEVLVTIREGKYHQVKRMFRAVGKEVLYLKRLSMGPLRLDPELAPGEFRALRGEEVEALRLV